MSDTKTLITGATTILLVRAIGTMASLGAMVIMTQLLGPEGTGLYGFSLAFVGAAALAIRFGVDRQVVKDLSSFYEDGQLLAINAYLRSILAFLAAFSVLGILALYVSLKVLTETFSDLNLLSGNELSIAIASIGSGGLTIFAGILQANERFGLSSLVQFTAHQLALFVVISVLAFGHWLNGDVAIASYAASSFSVYLCLLLYFLINTR